MTTPNPTPITTTPATSLPATNDTPETLAFQALKPTADEIHNIIARILTERDEALSSLAAINKKLAALDLKTYQEGNEATNGPNETSTTTTVETDKDQVANLKELIDGLTSFTRKLWIRLSSAELAEEVQKIMGFEDYEMEAYIAEKKMQDREEKKEDIKAQTDNASDSETSQEELAEEIDKLELATAEAGMSENPGDTVPAVKGQDEWETVKHAPEELNAPEGSLWRDIGDGGKIRGTPIPKKPVVGEKNNAAVAAWGQWAKK